MLSHSRGLLNATRILKPIQSSVHSSLPSSTMIAAASPSSLTLASTPSRSFHRPRMVRGVGPRPRTSAFYSQRWLKRRLIDQRAKFWPKTHATPILNQEVQQQQQQQITLPTRTFETGKETGSVSLDPTVFNAPLRRDVIWTVVRWQRAMRRTGHHKNKNRAEVFGSGKKARPQKGSGRARMGDPHAPHHHGGGNTWARKQADYSYDLPQNIINFGKRVALSAKAAEGNLFIVDEPVLSSAHSRAFAKATENNKWSTFLMVHLHGELDPNLALSSRKYDEYNFLSDRQLNVYDIVNAKRLVITRKALQSIEWRLNKANTSTRTRERTLRWMVGSFGGGYTREEVDFVKPGTEVGAGKIVPGVDIDGLQLVIKSGQPYEMPVHWP